MTEQERGRKHLLLPCKNQEMKIKKEYTDKSFLILEYTRLSHELKLDPAKYRFQSPVESYYINYCPVSLHPLNRVSLSHLINAPNKFLKGKVFVCRTVTPSIKMCSVLTVVEVPDLKIRNGAAILCLYNYLDPEDEFQDSSIPTLDPGTILTVNNPLFYRSSIEPLYSVRSDNAADVSVLSENEFKHFFPGYKWPSDEFQNEDVLVLKNASGEKTKDWLSTGHFQLEKKNYIGAIEAYTLAIKCNPKDLEALTHRCSLNLYLKIYKKSLTDSNTILNENSFHDEAICFKASSLIGMRQYSVAIQFLKSHIEDGTSLVDSVQHTKLMELQLKANTRSKQERYGDYDLVNMLRFSKTECYDCADYIGNVTKQYIEEKGLGIVATKDIKCGDLIIAEKAFAIAFPDKEVDHTQEWTYDKEKCQFHTRTQRKLIASIAHRLIRNPNLGKVFYKLHDGTHRTSVKYFSDKVEYKAVDMRRIEEICRFNAFSGEAISTQGTEKEDDRSVGLWQTVSYLNHSCFDANSQWRVCGDVMFVRACRNIFKFEEITLPYLSCTTQYPSRFSTLSKYGFVCNCSLCLLDSQDNDAVHSRRQEILGQLDQLETADSFMCNQIEKLITDLQALRPDHPQLNVCTFYPLMMLIEKYAEIKSYATAADLACRTYAIASSTASNEVSLRCCCVAMWCYLRCKNIQKAKNCGRALKSGLIQEFGNYSEEILKFHSPEVAEAMTEYDIVL